MGKRSKFKPHPPKPDRVYGSPTVQKLINKFMKNGEKGKAEKIIYEAAQKVEERWLKEQKLTETKEKKSSEKVKVEESATKEQKSEEESKKSSQFRFLQIWEQKNLDK